MLGKPKRQIVFSFVFVLLFLASCSSSGRYRGSHGPKIKHHRGFFTANDKATRKNEKMKKKTSKAGDNKKTSAKTAKKPKSSSRTTYVKTFDHH